MPSADSPLPDRNIAARPLDGRHVLVVEDEFVIADDIATMLRECGAEVIGPAATLPTAVRLADQSERIDAAVLNINLQGVEVFPLARDLRQRGVPFLFLTGYGEELIPHEFAEIVKCHKPVGTGHVLDKLKELLAVPV